MHRNEGEKKKGEQEGPKERTRERGVAAMPSQMHKGEWQSSGLATKKERKRGGRAGRKKGRADSYFSTVKS